MSKLRSLEEAASLVEEESTLAIGGLLMNSAPMTYCAELARRGTPGLEVVALVAGLSVDWLIYAGCVRRVVTALVSLEGFGLAPNFRRAAEHGQIDVEEWSEHTLISALQAGAAGLPYMPTRAGLGTDMPAQHPERTWVADHGGTPFLACAGLRPDVAVVHVHEADETGNARINPKLIWMDSELVKAAKTVIVTAERIVSERSFRAEPHRTSYPGYAVDVVVEAPLGAYPSSCFPEYAYDASFMREYAGAARDKESFDQFWRERITAPRDGPERVDANGGAGTLLRIRT